MPWKLACVAGPGNRTGRAGGKHVKGEEASSSFLPSRFLEISSFVPQKLAPAMRATWKVDRSRLVLLQRRRNLKE